MKIKTLLTLTAFAAMASIGTIGVTSAEAGINQSSDKRYVCKGKKSCDTLKDFCKRVGGTYTPAGKYGACDL